MGELLSDTAEEQTGNANWYTNTEDGEVSTTSCCNESCPEPVDVTVNNVTITMGTASGEGRIVTDEFEVPGDLVVGNLIIDMAQLSMAGFELKVMRNGNRQDESLFSLSTVAAVTRITFIAGEEFISGDVFAIEYAYLVA